MAIVKEDLCTHAVMNGWFADGLATIGITDYARNELGELVFAEAVSPGRRVVPGQCRRH